MEKETAILYAQMPEYKYLVQKTERFIQDALSKVNKPYVACSFGKDSSVMLHLILKYAHDIKILFVEYEETNLVDNFDDVINKWGCKNLDRIFIESFIDENTNEGDILKIYALKNNFDSSFVGLRKQESAGRRITLKKDGNFFKSKNGIIRICPLSEWNNNHIAAYCYSNNLPMLKSYDLGIEQRTTTGITIDSFIYSQLNRLKKIDISKYNTLLKKYSKLRNYV